MTARLRELAERWNQRGRVCKEAGSAVSGTQMIECATELLSILDAEGDGGAVSDAQIIDMAERCDGAWEIDSCEVAGLAADMLRAFLSERQSSQAVRVVSDEDVRDAARYRWLRSREGISYLQIFESAIDAAIQGERHE